VKTFFVKNMHHMMKTRRVARGGRPSPFASARFVASLVSRRARKRSPHKKKKKKKNPA